MPMIAPLTLLQHEPTTPCALCARVPAEAGPHHAEACAYFVALRPNCETCGGSGFGMDMSDPCTDCFGTGEAGAVRPDDWPWIEKGGGLVCRSCEAPIEDGHSDDCEEGLE